MKTTTKLASLFLLIALLFVPGSSHAQTAFTYQGQLRDGSTNANGTYALTFALFDAPGGGSQVGSTLAAPSLSIVNGLFTVALDFGGTAFDGKARWLQITVGADVLAPRVAVLPAPYALFAAVAGTVTNRAIMNAQLAFNAVATTNIQTNAITTALIADGAVTNRNLAANAVNTTNIQPDAVTATKILDNAVITSKISDDAVVTAKIFNGAVTDAKIVSVSGSKVSGAVASAIFASSATTAGTATLANSVADGSITTASLQGGAVTAVKVASGQVVKSLNGITDAVTLSAGQNVTLTPNGNDIQISATLTNSTVIGPWTIGTDASNYLAISTGGLIEMSVQPHRIIVSGRLNVINDGVNSGNISADNGITAGGAIIAGGSINGSANATFVGSVNAASFVTTSDRNAKQDFALVNPREVLARVTELPIQTWTFKQDAGTRHIGPMAQDFFAAFRLGTDDKHIATVDADGVALAAIQGLHSLVKDKEAEIAGLKQRLEALEKIVLQQNGGGR